MPGKQFDVLVRAVTQLPGVHLLLAGAGPEREMLRRMAEQFGSGDRIHLLGERDGAVDAMAGGRAADGRAADGPDIPGLLSAIDVFVSPSPDEAFGLAVLEALGSGLHVLYGSCPAVDELPADQAPGARHFSLGVHELATALRELRRGGRAGCRSRRWCGAMTSPVAPRR